MHTEDEHGQGRHPYRAQRLNRFDVVVVQVDFLELGKSDVGNIEDGAGVMVVVFIGRNVLR